MELHAEVQRRACLLHAAHGEACCGHRVGCWAAVHTCPLLGRSRAVVIGTSLTVEACHGTNILQLSARKAARVNVELRASKIGRFDGTELAHDDPDAPGIITGRPVVGEIWSIGGAGSASRHRRQAQRKGESMTTKIHGCNQEKLTPASQKQKF